MNIYNLNELSTTSESDSEYLVDSRYCRTTVKCKRKALKKTIKLIHGRCVVIYRGSGDLLPIAAKDADRNCYSDFVFVCHDPKPKTKPAKETSAMPRSRSALNESSTSESDDHDMRNNNFSYLTSHEPKHSTQYDTNESVRNEEIDVDVDKQGSSIIYFPSSHSKTTNETN
ncbi:unnamed protein product [Adineta ricciae]|uniref:Uncharacterized protein n=1 Tax=Adineta ricciae TaxID=249248 RepID=A0A814Z102_ADIRI|nr:unnamed protein product [Adineta ricciae]CAF1236346.1 unnamed protein product [Adineta ricciae]